MQPRRVPQEHLQRFPEPSLPARLRRQTDGGAGMDRSAAAVLGVH